MNGERRISNGESSHGDAQRIHHSPLSIRHYLSLYAALWRNSVIRELGFKANFLMWIVVEGLWFALQLTFIGVLYLHTENIGTWTKWQVVALVGTSHLIQQLFTALFLTNLTALSEHIRTGKLDFMLLLPVNARFLVSFRKVDLGGFVNAASALGVITYALHRLGHVSNFFTSPPQVELAEKLVHHVPSLEKVPLTLGTARAAKNMRGMIDRVKHLLRVEEVE